MEKYKYLLKNVLLFGISNFVPKILVFLMVPLYTNVLTTAEYGTVDLLQTTLSLTIPIVTINITEGVLRYSVSKYHDSKSVLFYGIKYITIGTAVVTGVGIILGCLNVIPWGYIICFILLLLGNNGYTLLTNFLRGIDKMNAIVIGSILNTAIMVGCNILFLLYFSWGMYGYLLAQIFALIIATIFLFIAGGVYKYITTYKKDNIVEREMVVYSKPLILNSISWWINNASARYIIVFFCGTAVNGIYSVAYKIPTILSMCQSIFIQAWQLSAIKESDSAESQYFYKKIYGAYNGLLLVACSGIIMLTKVLANFLYAKEFYVAWKYVPLLLIGTLFTAVSSYIASIFNAKDDTKLVGRTTTVGAVINIIISLCLVPFWGAMGAGIANAISCFVVWLARISSLKKKYKINLFSTKLNIMYILILFQGIIMILETPYAFYINGIVVLIVCLAFHNMILEFIRKILKKVKR